MKKTLLLLFLASIFVFARHPTGHAEAYRTAIPEIENETSLFFVLEFERSPDGLRKDTLFVSCDGPEYRLIFKGDTIAGGWSFASPVNFISPLGAIGCANTFLMTTYQGDGCPMAYQLLAFKEDASCFLSEIFGNCNDLASINNVWPETEFKFEAMKEANRKKASYLYNGQNYTFKEKK